jgi:hypothetical protein
MSRGLDLPNVSSSRASFRLTSPIPLSCLLSLGLRPPVENFIPIVSLRLSPCLVSCLLACPRVENFIFNCLWCLFVFLPLPFSFWLVLLLCSLFSVMLRSDLFLSWPDLVSAWASPLSFLSLVFPSLDHLFALAFVAWSGLVVLSGRVSYLSLFHSYEVKIIVKLLSFTLSHLPLPLPLTPNPTPTLPLTLTLNPNPNPKP